MHTRKYIQYISLITISILTYSTQAQFDATGWETEQTSQTEKILSIGHTGWVNSAQFNPSGSLLVTASDSFAIIWDPFSGKLLHKLKGHVKTVNSAVFNATGSHIVTTSRDETAKIWNAETGELLHTLQGHNEWVCLARYNVDGSRLVTASEESTKIWHAVSGRLL
ncbi:MAG: WD40 repeat domain-containing protein, partial [Bacteroidia bacterium]